MNKLIRLSLFFILVFQIQIAFGQIEVTSDKVDAIYKVGEVITFQVESSASGEANYKITYDERSAAIETGTINLTANQVATVSYIHDEPGVVSLSVVGPSGMDLASVTIAPFDIQPLEAEPSDFDQYWNTQTNLVSTLSTSPELLVHSTNAQSTTYTIALPNVDGRKVYAYLTVPEGSGPFPAAIIFPAFGNVAAASPQIDVAERGGLITVSLSVHNVPVTEEDPNAYQPNDPANRDQIYMRYALTGAINILNYLETRADFDKQNVCAMGVSQGGGLAMMFAGIDDRVNLLVNSNPSLNEHQGFKYGQASGFPYYLSNANGSAAVSNAIKYYDAMYASRRFKGVSYTLVGLQDMIVPSATALAGYNQLSGEKVLMISRDGGHGHPGEYWNGRFDFLRRHYQLNPPFEFAGTTKGYTIDAGADIQVVAMANLNATVFFDNQNLNNLDATWIKVSGPGNVSFSDATSNETTATFSEAGKYVLRFRAQDNKNLDSEGKMYFLSDDITVTAGSVSATDDTETEEGIEEDVATIDSTAMSSVLLIDCPTNITQNTGIGQNSVIVSWNDPSVTSTCSQGGTSGGDCSTNLLGYSYLGTQDGASFFLSDNSFTWIAAKEHAQQSGGTLAVINNQTENDLIQQAGDIVYIGLSDEASEGTFEWVDGSPLNFTNYQTDPANTEFNDYVVLNPWDGSWGFYNRFVAKKYILKIPCGEGIGGGTAGTSISQISGPAKGSAFPIGTTRVSYEATDACGNIETCSFNVTVASLSSFLSLSCPSNQSVDLEEGSTAINVFWQEPIVATTCPNGLDVLQIAGQSPNSSFEAGDYDIIYRAIDACENAKECSFRIRVQSAAAENLTLVCPNSQEVELNAGASEIQLNWPVPTSRTNCLNGGTITQLSGPRPNSAFNVGSYNISYQSTDNCGYNATCSFTIAVKAAPIITPPVSELVLDCEGNISVQLNRGENGRVLFWNAPTIMTTCPLDNSSSTTCQEQSIDGYSYLGRQGESLYYRSNESSKWESARLAAIAAGGELLKIETADENEFIQQTLQAGYFYIGLTDAATEGTFSWSDGSATTYTNYDTTRSNSTESNNYLFNSWSGVWVLAGADVYAESILEVKCQLAEIVNADTSFVEQTSGPSSGTFINIGTTNIAYIGVDACGNTATCNFVITLIPDTTTANNSININPDLPYPNTTECMIRAQSVSLVFGNTIGGKLDNLINGSGLQSESLSATHESGQLYDGVWLNAGLSPVLEFDLGSVQAVDGLFLWNYSYHDWLVLKRRGINNFAISTANDTEDFGSETFFSTDPTMESGLPEPTQYFPLPKTFMARKIRLRVFNAISDPDYVGFGEIRFSSNCGAGALQESTERTDGFNRETTINTTATNFGELSIAPNPTPGRFFVDLSALSQEPVQVKVYNEIGKLIYTNAVKSVKSELAIDLEDQPNGIYFVRVFSNSTAYKLHKLVKQ